MKGLLLLVGLFVLFACAGRDEKIEPDVEIAGFVPPQITQKGVDAGSFDDGLTRSVDRDGRLWLTRTGDLEFDVEIAQTAPVGNDELRKMRLWLEMAGDAFERGEHDLAQTNAREALDRGPNDARAKQLLRIAAETKYNADRLKLRKNFNEEWRSIMERLEYDAMPHPDALNYPNDWPSQPFWDKITRISPIRSDRTGPSVPPALARTWKRSSLAAHSSRLRVGADEFLPLEATHLAVRVDGFRARVVVDLFYRNDHAKQLSGKLQLRLPHGASPDYTAFGVTQRREFADTPGTTLAAMRTQRPDLREARMVPREKAAHAFDETVRRRVDPALVEWSGAGVYDIQVFPLQPGKLHQISISYTTDLVPQDGHLDLDLGLPDGPVRIDIRTSEGEHRRLHNPTNRSHKVRVRNPGQIRMNGKDAELGEFYACRFTPDLPTHAATPVADAIFLVDTSSSSKLEDWLALLDQILVRNEASLKRFHVVFFDMGARCWRTETTANTSGHRAALQAYARSLEVSGATDLGAALTAAATVKGRHDLFLLSDGAATWGEADLHALRSRIGADQTLFAYTTGRAGTDMRTLSHLARESGGAVFTVTDTASMAHAAVAHTCRPWRVVGIDAPGTDALLRGRPTSIYPGQALVVTGRGRLRADSAIALRLQRGNRTIRVPIGAAEPIESPLVPGIYGEVAVGQLEAFGAITEDDSRAYAMHFRVVGQTCSLLMLESEADYARFSIDPVREAAHVRAHSVSTAVATAQAQLTAGRSSARARLRAFLQKLEHTPGLRFEIDEPIAALLDAADPDDLEVPLTSAEALRELGNDIERAPGDTALAHAVGYAALARGAAGEAYHLFRRAAAARPYEPHHYLAMALALEAAGKTTLARIWYEVATAARWNERYGDVRDIACAHYRSFLVRIGDLRANDIKVAPFPETADVVVTIIWNTDRTDLDLHVRDASGEECAYDHRRTAMGGAITRDITSGYGPEMFVLPHAKAGKYAAWIVSFADDANLAGTRTTAYAIVTRNWGRPDQSRTGRVITLRPGANDHAIEEWSLSEPDARKSVAVR